MPLLAGNSSGRTATELANAQNLYAVLTGRVSGFNSNAILKADGKYHFNVHVTSRFRKTPVVCLCRIHGAPNQI